MIPPDVMSNQNRIPNGLGITKYSFIKRRGVLLHTREQICKSAIFETRCLKTQARPAAQRFFSFYLCRLIQNNDETAIVLPWTPPVCIPLKK